MAEMGAKRRQEVEREPAAGQRSAPVRGDKCSMGIEEFVLMYKSGGSKKVSAKQLEAVESRTPLGVGLF